MIHVSQNRSERPQHCPYGSRVISIAVRLRKAARSTAVTFVPLAMRVRDRSENGEKR